MHWEEQLAGNSTSAVREKACPSVSGLTADGPGMNTVYLYLPPSLGSPLMMKAKMQWRHLGSRCDLTFFSLPDEWSIEKSNSEHFGLPQTRRGGPGGLSAGLGHTQSITRFLCGAT